MKVQHLTLLQNNMKRFLSIISVALISIIAAAQTNSSIYTPGISSEGLNYYLPKTKITLTVTVSKTVNTPGEFSRYAERYLRLNNVIEEESQKWEITDITLKTSGVPDKDKLYTLSFAGQTQTPYFELTEDGILSAVNTHKSKEQETTKEQAIIVQKTDPYDFLTEEILMSGSTAKMAELTAKEIYATRESRNYLTRGQAENMPKDGESLQLFLDELEKQEKALTQLFTGTTETEEKIFTIDITPSASVSKQIAFRFSSKLGVLSTDNLAGEPVYIDVEDLKYLPKTIVDEKKDPKFLEKHSNSFLFYVTPGRAAIKVYDNRTTFLSTEKSIAQFGNIEILTHTLIKKRPGIKITFNTSTGNIESIED